MPTVHIELFEGRSLEQKRACAKAVTEAVAATCNCPPQAVQVVFVDVAKSDWAIAGTLASDPEPDA